MTVVMLMKTVKIRSVCWFENKCKVIIDLSEILKGFKRVRPVSSRWTTCVHLLMNKV